MVECVYHLAPVLHYTKDANERNASVTALQAANGILIQLSSKLNVAKKALRALNGVMLRWASGNSPGNTGQEGSHHNEVRIDVCQKVPFARSSGLVVFLPCILTKKL